MTDIPQRVTLGRMENPVRGFLHAAAAVLALVGTVLLFFRAPTVPARIAAAVFGLGMAGLYTTSALYHSVPWSLRWKRRMQRADHSMIYVLVASTYTPVAVAALDGWLRGAVLVTVWTLTAVGVAQQAWFPRERNTFSVALSTTLGWLAVVIMWPVARSAGTAAVVLLALGGVLYTVGMVFLVTNRPRLWPRVFSYHEAFHVLVVAASALHFTAIYRHVLPAAL